MRLLIAPLLLLPATSAAASTGAAWDAFRQDVRAACRSLAPQEAAVTVEVNPYGSEHYGVAIVTVDTESGTDRMICIYDKASHAAELSAPFAE